MHIGIDVGGTFTDSVLIDDGGHVWHAKVPTLSADLTQSFFNAIQACLAEAGKEPGGTPLRVAHGTTLATNSIVQRNGAAVALLTTSGFRDTIHIMQGRAYTAGLPDDAITNFQEISKPQPIVSKSFIGEIVERVDSMGNVVVDLDLESARKTIGDLIARGVGAFAICFLWSFLNPDHELRVRDLVAEMCPDAYVSVSHEVSPTAGEYARTNATVINSYVGPGIDTYLHALEQGLLEREVNANVSILQCTGGSVSVAEARKSPVRLIGSGPVGGTIACRNLGRALDEENVIAVDMGGTTFDVSLIVDGQAIRKSLGVVNQYEYSVPTIDVQSIGSGGGSVVWIDERSGAVRVGPRSAGSTPGPACYGRGGHEPTVTDCDLVLGYLSPDASFGGGISLDSNLASEAIRKHVAEPLGMSVEKAALGALTIVDFQMAELMRQVTVGNGFDPRDFVVFAYGGAGPMHAPVFARELGAKSIVVPGGALASVWSAYGAVSSDAVVVLERSHARHEPFDARELESAFAAVELEARAKLREFGAGDESITTRRYADLKYGMQAHVVAIDLPSPVDQAVAASIPELLDARYESIFGPGTAYREAGVVMTRIRVEAVVPDPTHVSSRPPADGVEPAAAEIGQRPVWWPAYGAATESPVYDGAALSAGTAIEGPAIIELALTTISVHPGQVVRTDAAGNFLIELERAPVLERVAGGSVG